MLVKIFTLQDGILTHDIEVGSTVLSLLKTLAHELNVSIETICLLHFGKYQDFDKVIDCNMTNLTLLVNKDENFLEKSKIFNTMLKTLPPTSNLIIAGQKRNIDRMLIIAELSQESNPNLSNHILSVIHSNNHQSIFNLYEALSLKIPAFRDIISKIDNELNFDIPDDVDMTVIRRRLTELLTNDDISEEDKKCIACAIRYYPDNKDLYRIYLGYMPSITV